MSIRLRLTVFYSILLIMVLIITGFGVHLLLKKSLENNLDQTILETSKIIISSFEYDENDEEPHFDNDILSNDMSVAVFDKSGTLLTSFAKNIKPLAQYSKLPYGFSWYSDKRVYAKNIAGNKLMLIHNTEFIEETLKQFANVYKTIIPIIALLSFFLGSVLVKQALRPVAKLTTAAYNLAEKKIWQEKLPEPKVKDELWQLTKAFNSLLDSLENLIETEKRFTADASHELRTPLTVLQGRIEQILENPNDANNPIRLKKAQEKTTELSNIVENLLRLTRAEAGQGLKKERIAIDELVFQVAEEMGSLYRAKGIGLEPNLPQEPAYIMADRFAISQLIRNLLENSLKFCKKGSVKINVDSTKENVILSIEDEGIGIKEKDLEKVFDRFFQADSSHHQSGSGLGLAIVKSIADWHSAKIELKNNPTDGVQFKILFPALS